MEIKKLLKGVKNSLVAYGSDVPKDKIIMARVKNFYANRRGVNEVKKDPVKLKKRKKDVKLTFE